MMATHTIDNNTIDSNLHASGHDTRVRLLWLMGVVVVMVIMIVRG